MEAQLSSTVDYDLIVAGAGPAGCALAAKCAKAGASVLLLEQAARPGEGRGWIVDIEKSAFEAAAVPRPSPGALWKEPEKTVVLSPSRGHVVELPPVQSDPVLNDVYAMELAAWAEESGATVRCGARVSGPLVDRGAVQGVSMITDGSTELAFSKIVADCTGIGGSVRRGTPEAWGMSEPVGSADIVMARREMRRIDAQAARRAVRRGVVSDRLRTDCTGPRGAYSVETFYLDIESGVADLLVGIKPDPRLPTADERFDEIVEEYGFIGEKIFGGSGPIPLRRPLDSLVADGLLVLGDSACQVIPVCGSGVASALIAADIASRAVGRALRENRFDRQALWEYGHGFQSGRGALLSYYDVVRSFTDTLESSDVEWLIAHKVMTAEEVISGLTPRVFKPRPSAMLGKLVNGRGRIKLLADFAMVGLKAMWMMRRFGAYPKTYDPDALSRWARGLPRYP